MMTGMGFGFGGVFIMALFWFGIIAGAIWIIKIIFSSTQQKQSVNVNDQLSAEEMLDLRYAKGEIDREEYKLIKNDIS